MQKIEIESFSSKMNDKGELILYIPSVNDPDYLEVIDDVELVVFRDTIEINYIYNEKVERSVKFPELKIQEVMHMMNKETVVIFEMASEGVFFYPISKTTLRF